MASVKRFSEIDTSTFVALKPRADSKSKIITVMMQNGSGNLERIIYQAPKMKIPFGISNNAKYLQENEEPVADGETIIPGMKWHINSSFQGEENQVEIGEYRRWLEECITKGLECYLPNADTYTPRNKGKKHTLESLEEMVSPIIIVSGKEGRADTTKESIPSDYKTGIPYESIKFYEKSVDGEGKKVVVESSYENLTPYCDAIRILQFVGFKINPTGKQLFPFVNVVQCLFYKPQKRAPLSDTFKDLCIQDDEESEEEYFEEEEELEVAEEISEEQN